MNRLLFLWLGSVLLFGLSACEDASTVGVDLIGEQGEPSVTRLTTSRFEAVPLKDVTGGSGRVLAGTADDPLLGLLDATGYMDFTGPFGTPDDSTLVAVNVLLQPNYVYGDTAATLTLTLQEILEDWAEASALSDTTLPFESTVLVEQEFLPTDTLVSVPLPESWIARYEENIHGATFTDAFHGFALRTAAPGAVVGFSRATADLQIITPTDTVLYPATKSLSALRREAEPMLPADQVLIQDGVGPTVAFDFDYADLLESPLNGVFIRVYADSASVLDTPPNFVRPLLRNVFLQAVALNDEDEEIVIVSIPGTVDDQGNLRFTSNALRTLLQGALFEPDLFDHFRLFPPGDVNTLNPLLLYLPTSGERAPEALLTLSPSGR